MDLNPGRAWLKQPDYFQRFRVPDRADRLADLGIGEDELVAIVRRGDAQRAILVRQLTWEGAPLTVRIGPDGIPVAAREDGSAPMQLFMRWYGFAYTWPHGDIYGATEG